jgi:hypothetical protein
MLLSLHFSYFNCLISVHRLTTLRDSNVNLELARSHSSGLLPSDVALISGALCQNAARASIRLIEYMPQRCASILGYVPGSTQCRFHIILDNFSFHALIGSSILLHYLIKASTSLSTSIIYNPRLVSRVRDMKPIHQVECFMSSIALASPKEKLKRLVKHCVEYRTLAESAMRDGEATSN